MGYWRYLSGQMRRGRELQAKSRLDGHGRSVVPSWLYHVMYFAKGEMLAGAGMVDRVRVHAQVAVCLQFVMSRLGTVLINAAVRPCRAVT